MSCVQLFDSLIIKFVYFCLNIPVESSELEFAKNDLIAAGGYGEIYRAKILRPDFPETIAYKKIVAASYSRVMRTI